MQTVTHEPKMIFEIRANSSVSRDTKINGAVQSCSRMKPVQARSNDSNEHQLSLLLS